MRRIGVSERIEESVIILVVLTLGIDKLFVMTVLGSVHMSVQIVVLLFASVLVATDILIRDRLPKNFFGLFFVLMVAWFTFESLRSVEMARAMTYLLLLVLCGALYLRLSSRLSSDMILRINRKIYFGGAILYFALFCNYLYILLTRSEVILAHRALWDVGSSDVYEVQFGKIIAFQGYSGDPNAVGIGVAIVLFCGLSIRFRRFDFLRHVINFMLVGTILASNSRGALLALLLCFLAGGLFMRLKNYGWYLAVVVFGAGALAVMPLLFGSGGFNPISKIGRGASSRFEQWSAIFDAFSANPLFGNGLRYSEYLLGKYTENSYLTLMNETGVIGLALYLFVIALPVLLILMTGRYRRPSLKPVMPWVIYSLYLAMSMMYISMEVKPILWVTVGILTWALFSPTDEAAKGGLTCQSVTSTIKGERNLR